MRGCGVGGQVGSLEGGVGRRAGAAALGTLPGRGASGIAAARLSTLGEVAAGSEPGQAAGSGRMTGVTDRRDAQPEALRRAVGEHGWVVVSTPATRGRPASSSTVGLTELGMAELVVLGLADDVGGALVREVAARLAQGELVPDGVPLAGVLDSGAPMLAPVAGEVVGLPACDLYGGAVRFRQLAWPDGEGLLPWQPGFAHPDLQPALAIAADGPHTQVLTSRKVVAGAPALMVVRDEGLRLLDGVSDFDPHAAIVECLHDAVDRDPSIGEAVASVGEGEVAGRDAPGRPWRVASW